jgi:hypothetical protein
MLREGSICLLWPIVVTIANAVKTAA